MVFCFCFDFPTISPFQFNFICFLAGDFASWQQFCALMHQIISYCAQLELQFCSLGQYCPNTGPDDDQEEAELKAAHLKAREFMTTILKVQGKEAASYLVCTFLLLMFSPFDMN
jgi:hypothetical protein